MTNVRYLKSRFYAARGLRNAGTEESIQKDLARQYFEQGFIEYIEIDKPKSAKPRREQDR